VDLEITAGRKAVTGKAWSRVDIDGQQISVDFDLVGGFFHDRFLKLNYRNLNPANIQFGAIILELASDPKKMNGVYAGYGSISDGLVSGTVELAR
jgi:hypothetical protein